MTRVKVCGLTTDDDLAIAVDAGADAVGIVCDVPVETPREVSTQRAETLAASVPPFVTSVLVTMPESAAAAIDLVEAVGPDAVQVHGTLDPDELAEVRSSVAASVLFAIDAEGAADVATVERYDEVADALLVDSTSEDGGGGTGETHDWNRTRTIAADLDSPLILAGGLTPENVAEAVRTVEPFAVDVASGVERDGGTKDPDAVRSFVERATTADRQLRPESP
ncbi:phosphoribosylanthranilate isomerase [Halosolutus gelatinilyticus]|uniref:phosphoribosylanthranilate isomerase n=1 Tax=Halosolutus gelatinilyticus TaxID=2931975 RepID=UPI001FF4E629|nr:phosphoribosylanthranilate isomerase [Halosolutus gelatinilyticus]